ncbi:MAG TPA: pyridoxamine 5'-phosphate oxidase [Candidatus Micrarchaeia archaeon]|nr:pyridoxamine 5'-phosphate oxidase [Candidatus Micrarchaeia archaeon]
MDDPQLEPGDLGPDPLAALRRWLAAARAAGELQPEAMTLATVAADGAPRARMVLLKGLDPSGLTFFTNHASDKGRELAHLPLAAAVLYWPRLHRQVRCEGTVRRISRQDSRAYFESRPRGARVSAAISPQSRPVPDRAWLEARSRAYADRHPAKIPLPLAWGGFQLRPARVEFWQGRRDRLHDRLRFTRAGSGWVVERLAP